MKKLIRIFLLLIFSLVGVNLNAQDINFSASGPTVIGVGEQFQIKFKINSDDVSKFIAPSISGFEILGGPSTSRSSSYSVINGKMQNNSSSTFTYVLHANKEGTFTIGGAKINSNGKTYTSNSLTIKVQKNPTQAQRAQTQNGYSQNRDNQPPITVLDNKALFIKAFANKSQAVVGEEIIITYKLYTLVPISEYQVNQMPINKGFWIEEIDMSKDPIITNERIDGKNYQVATLRKVIAYPQQSGKLSIAPLDIDVVAHISTTSRRRVSSGDPFFDSFFNDPFFQSLGQTGYERVKKNIKSNKISIDVKSLPKTNSDFSGAVGNFQITASSNPLSCKTNETITLRYTISGSGNLSLIDKINLKIPDDFESYDPTIDDKINKTQSGVNGKRTFEYILIPRVQGEFKIPKVDFTYFDIKTKQYKTISTQEFSLKIAKGKDELSGLAQQITDREKYLKRDIEHINTKKIKFISSKDLDYQKPFLFIIFLIIPILTIAFIIYKNRTNRRNKDITYVKYKKATKVALQRMKKAKIYLANGDKENFYTEVSQATWNYLSDRFKIVKMDLSFENIKDILDGRNINEQTIQNLISLLHNCEYVRFSPIEETSKMDNLYQQAINSLSDIESQIK
ncbi:MAG: BatD family protein [Bacteroidales bacterium]|nr:BatD family protein [Bacteroidales bacterium]